MTWAEIKAAVTALAHRSDLAAIIPVLQPLAEQRINLGESVAPKVRVRAMQKTVTQVDGVMPADFLEAVQIKGGGSNYPIDFVPLNQLQFSCEKYSWDGETLVLSTGLGFPVELTYYGKFDPLVNDTDTNWLTENAPGVYVASLLIEIARWSRDDVLASREAGNYVSAVNAVTGFDNAAKASGSRLVMRNHK